MRLLNLVALTIIVVLIMSWLSIVLYPSAQDFMKANPFWNGLRDWSLRFHAELVNDLGSIPPEPETVLVVIPYLPYSAGELRLIESFVREGGTLLLLDDYGYGNQVLKALGLGMRFYGQPMLDPFMSYKNQWLPKVTDLSPWLSEAGIKTLALNHATALKIEGDEETLAHSSDTAYIDLNGNEVEDEGEPKGPLVVAAQSKVGRGRVIAVSDPSILINSMVGMGDNDAFLRWLISLAGEEPRVILDTSHLPKAPLDRSKDSWEVVRERLSLPYSQVLLIGIILALILMPWKGGKIE